MLSFSQKNINYFSLTNLKYWAMQGDILELSLLLLKDLSLGYTAVRKLFRLNEVQLLLSNHTVRITLNNLTDIENLLELFNKLYCSKVNVDRCSGGAFSIPWFCG